LRREQLTLLPLGKIGFAPPRSKSRNVGAERFTAKRMAREYLVVYRSLIEFEALRLRGAVARTSFR
jgi:hypothetical protein